ncbi:MAG TPA: hypothetical protein VGQ39_14910 [Pyrinomonadaceae bacterium]|jgi:hypothetical protein|nr:hypothetical protein [Pyrinomonadaceae bacterium]
MFIGHFAVGLGAKRFAPKTSMAALIAAPILVDVLWSLFVLLGLEQVRIDPGNTNAYWGNSILTVVDFMGLVVRQTSNP